MYLDAEVEGREEGSDSVQWAGQTIGQAPRDLSKGPQLRLGVTQTIHIVLFNHQKGKENK